MPRTKRSSVLLFSLLISSLFLYFQTSPNKKFDSGPTSEKVSHPAAESKARLNHSYGKLPIRFEANMGQTDERVKFLAREKGYSLFLTPQEAVMVLPVGPAKSAADSVKKVSLENNETQLAAIRMSLLNANPSPKMFGEDELISKSNYFIGSDPEKWRTNVGNFGRVRYEEAYPGIDLVYYGNPQQLEYDFIVSPGADPDVIKIKFAGQDEVEIDASGNLVLKAGSGRFVQNAPVIYQSIEGKRIPVESRYVLLGEDSVGFHIGEYDRDKDLVIDPELEFSTYLGGTGLDSGLGIAVDSSGNAYITGSTLSSDFPVVGGVDSTPSGSQDVFVSKLNAAGSALIYSTYLGSAGSDEGKGIVVDSSGNAYVTGKTASSDFPVVGGVDSTLGGTQDAFVSKLNAAGSALTYSTYLGGAGSDDGKGIAVDSSGNAYVTGDTQSTDFPTTAGAFATTNGGLPDAFVSKLNTTGSALTYSTYLGGARAEIGFGIAVDASGNAYLTGQTISSDFPTTGGALDTTFTGGAGGSGDAFVSKLNAAGSALIYSTYLGGSLPAPGVSLDIAKDIAVDSSGNAYITGFASSTDFPTTAGAFATTLKGSNDAFISKLNAAGSALIYSTFLGGTSHDGGNGIAVDSSGNAYVTGDTGSTDFPTTAGSFDTTNIIPKDDAFISKLNAAGSALIYSTYLGGAGDDEGNAIAVDSFGDAYAVGDTASSDFPLTGTVLDGALGGTQDAYIVKIIGLAGAVPPFNSRFGVLSPYWQSEAGIYTFISVNHPSLSGMNSQIGVAMSAVNQGGLQGTLEFTLSSNSSQRLFITTSNFAFGPDSNPGDLFLITGSSPRRGRLQFAPIASNPESFLGIANSSGRGFPDITALTFWGAIVVLNSSTGFAMEFIGDMQDSRAFSSANFSGVN